MYGALQPHPTRLSECHFSLVRSRPCEGLAFYQVTSFIIELVEQADDECQSQG